MLVKVLGGLDLASALAFLMLTFGMSVPIQYILFCSGLLFIKGLFVFTGEPLSAIDLISSILLVLSLIVVLPAFLVWTPAMLLLAKGFVSFI